MMMNDELLQYGLDFGMSMNNEYELNGLFDFLCFFCQVLDMFQPFLVVMEEIAQRASLLSLDCSQS